MIILRTPDNRFSHLPGYNFKPQYMTIPDGEQGSLRVHYLDEGDEKANPVLLMHGEPSWSYLYRRMIPVIIAAGHRVVAPDLVGFGRSDKPADRKDYTYKRHVDWMQALVDELDLRNITLVCQDWGGLIGLRLVAENMYRFDRVVAANTGLPTGDLPITDAFLKWQRFSQEAPKLDIGMIIKMGSAKTLSQAVLSAYEAPFPDNSFKAGARIFPTLVPTTPDDPASQANRRAWKTLRQFKKPFLTAFSDSDPITKNGELVFQKMIPGAMGQKHAVIKGGGHFLQEDCGEELAEVVVNFIDAT